MALYIGVMSGTSMDGVDAVLCDITPAACRTLAQASLPYPATLQATLAYLARTPTADITTMGKADRQVASVFAQAVNTLLDAQDLNADDITAIGSHGQTILHAPLGQPAFSLQIGDIATLAAETGIDVIGDFRRKDIALGGQGAPLAPAFHAFQFADASCNRFVVNIGGIANITVLAAAQDAPVSGFDTGPGNTLMDAWCQQYKHTPYDENGDWAATGKPDQTLLSSLLADDYFAQSAPKSTGPEYFNLHWLTRHMSDTGAELLPNDVQATLLSLTCKSICNSVIHLSPALPEAPTELIICGGGAFNRRLVSAISDTLHTHDITTATSTRVGLHPQWVEGAAFAWLAWAYQHDVPGNLPAVTGASRPAVLGEYCKAI